MNVIKISKVNVDKNIITVNYDVSGEWKKFFGPDRCFWVEYSSDIQNTPESVAVVPIMGTLITLSWIYDAEIIVDELDEDFYNSIPEFKKGYKTMYPKVNFQGKLSVNKIVRNTAKAEKKCGSLFSGGVDAFQTLLSHFEEKPILLSVWGADIGYDNYNGWQIVETHIIEMAKLFKLNYEVIRSNFRKVVDEGLLHSELKKKTGDGWWHGFQSGTGMLTLMAPYAYCYGLQRIYIASSFTKENWGHYTCSSDPIIDNYIRYAGAKIAHDGYEFNRQDKIQRICEFSKNNHIRIPLRVCWESDGGTNCCKCEKCCRTILGIYAEKENPIEYGFEYLPNEFTNIMNKLRYYKMEINQYLGLQKRLRENYKFFEIDKSIRWFYKKHFDVNKEFYTHISNGHMNIKEKLYDLSPGFIKNIYNKFTYCKRK